VCSPNPWHTPPMYPFFGNLNNFSVLILFSFNHCQSVLQKFFRSLWNIW
jgi:hypothetical protein